MDKQTEQNPARRRFTLVIRAFANEDGDAYGIISDSGAHAAWQASFSQLEELLNLIHSRLTDEPSDLQPEGRYPSPDDTDPQAEP